MKILSILNDSPYGSERTYNGLRGLVAKEVPVGACRTCTDARGLIDADLDVSAHRSSMAKLTAWILWADKVVTF